VLRGRRADHQAMSHDDDDRSGTSLAKGIGGFLLVVIFVNVLLRVVPVPDLDLPSISLPDFPAWVHTVMQVKNWALGVFIVVVIVCVAIEQHAKRDGEDAGDGAEQPR
jgi:hypothetical protein